MSLFDEMAVFTRVVEAGSFTAAADVLGLSNSRTSEAVQSLERRLGARLLDRNTRRVSPTEAGRVFYEHCRRALEEADAGVALVRARQEEPSGDLRIGAPDVFAERYVVPALASFLARHPKVRVELVESARSTDVIGERLDLVVRIARAPQDTLIVRRLGTSDVIVVAAPDHLDRHFVPDEPSDVARQPCIGFAGLHWAREWPFRTRGGEEVVVPVQPALVCSGTASMAAAARAGAGLVAIPSWAVADELREGTLVRVLAEWRLPSSGIYAVYPSNRLVAPKVRRFVEHLAPILKAKLPRVPEDVEDVDRSTAGERVPASPPGQNHPGQQDPPSC